MNSEILAVQRIRNTFCIGSSDNDNGNERHFFCETNVQCYK